MSNRIFFSVIAILVILTGIIGIVANSQSQTAATQYETLQNRYNSLQSQINALQTDHDNMTSLYNTLLGHYNELLALPGLTYDITDYGATPNDQTDDSMAFTKILSAHPSNIQIRVPSGVFLLSTAIHLDNNDNVIIFGEGVSSVIRLSAQSNILRIEDSSNVVLKDLTLDGNSKNVKGTMDGVNTGFHADYLQLQRVYIHNTTGNGITVLVSRNAIINECKFANIGVKGVNTHVSGIPICLNSVDGAQITNNQINGFFGDGGILTSGGGALEPTRNILIDGNIITAGHSDEGSGIHIWQGSKLIISNNIVHDSEILYSSDDVYQGINGISVFYGDNILLNSNEVYKVSGVGMEIHGVNIEVVKNHIYEFIEDGEYSCGLWLSAANALIENNTIADSTNHGIIIGYEEIVMNDKNSYPSDNEQIINNIIKDTKKMEHEDSAGIRLLLEGGDKKYLTIRDNLLINNMYGIWKSGSGQLIDPAITDNTITGSDSDYVDVSPTS